jgi:hypothetical protein
LLHLGRLFFAISLAAFGIQYLLYGRFVGGLPPVPPWSSGGAVDAYLLGTFLLAAAVSIVAHWKARLAATLVGLLFFLCVVLLHFLQFSPIIYSGLARTLKRSEHGSVFFGFESGAFFRLVTRTGAARSR